MKLESREEAHHTMRDARARCRKRVLSRGAMPVVTVKTSSHSNEKPFLAKALEVDRGNSMRGHVSGPEDWFLFCKFQRLLCFGGFPHLSSCYKMSADINMCRRFVTSLAMRCQLILKTESGLDILLENSPVYKILENSAGETGGNDSSADRPATQTVISLGSLLRK